MLEIGICLDRIAAIEPDPTGRVFIGIDYGNRPDYLILCYGSDDIAEIADGYEHNARLPLPLGEHSNGALANLVVGRALHKNRDALAELLRIAEGRNNVAVALVVGTKDDTLLVVELPLWARPFGTCAGAA